jgi:hypothetical protein
LSCGPFDIEDLPGRPFQAVARLQHNAESGGVIIPEKGRVV